MSNKNIDKECYININKYYNHICQDVIDNVSELDTAIKIGKKELYNKILLELQNESFHGMEDAKKDISNIEKHSVLLPHSTVKLDVFKKDIEDSLNKTFQDIKEKIKKNGTEPETISSIFEAMKYRIRFLLNYTVLKAYWHSYLSVGKSFDYDKIAGRLCIRFRHDGDRMVVNSSGDERKLKKEFIDRKVPESMRNKVLLVSDEAGVLWAMGVRRSERAYVDGETRNVLEIRIEEQ